MSSTCTSPPALTPCAPPPGDKAGPSPRMRYFTRPAENSSKHSVSASAPIAGNSFSEEDSHQLVLELLAEHSRPMALSESSSTWGVSPMAGPTRGDLVSQSLLVHCGGDGGNDLAAHNSLSWGTPDGLAAQNSSKRVWRRQSNDCPMYLPQLPVEAAGSVNALLRGSSGDHATPSSPKSAAQLAANRLSGNGLLPEKSRLPPVDHPALAGSPSYVGDSNSGDPLAHEPSSSSLLAFDGGRCIIESESSAGRFPGFPLRRLSIETSNLDGRRPPAPLAMRSPPHMPVDLSPTSPLSRATSIIDQWDSGSPGAGQTPPSQERQSWSTAGGGSSGREGSKAQAPSPAGQSRAAASLLKGFVAAAAGEDISTCSGDAQRHSRARHLFKAAVWTAKVMTSLNGIAAKRTGDEKLDAAGAGLSPESSDLGLGGGAMIAASPDAGVRDSIGSMRDGSSDALAAIATEHPAVQEFSKAFSQVLDRRKSLATNRNSFAIDRDAPRLSFALERGNSLARERDSGITLDQDMPRLALPIGRDAPRLSFALDRANVLPPGPPPTLGPVPEMARRFSFALDKQPLPAPAVAVVVAAPDDAARAALLQRFNSLPYAGLGEYPFRSREAVNVASQAATHPETAGGDGGRPRVSLSLSRLDVLHEHQPPGEPPLTPSRRPNILARAGVVGGGS